MEDSKATPSVYADNRYEGRGVGGKARKPTSRKQQATPYARPPPNSKQSGGGGWLSKIVDPASRLITSGATKIFPSFFSKSVSSPALAPAENNDRLDAELTVNAEDSGKSIPSSLLSRSVERGGPSEVADGLNRISDQNETVKNSSDGTDFSRLEQLVKGRTFSREEINYLLEILNSRVDVEGQMKPDGEGSEQGTFTQEIPKPPVEEKQDTERPVVGTSIQNSDVTLMHEIPRTPVEGKHGDRARLIGTSFQKDVADAIGASPVDIAQAYMGSRTSERGQDPYSFMSKSKRAQPLIDEVVAKPFVPSSSLKSSICWPGAEVHDGRGYVTPLSQRGRYGHIDFPRTPYSRSTASKSGTKLQADSRFQTRSSTLFQQSQTSIYGQEKIGGDAVNGYGSAGPIRRIRNKFASEVRPRGSIFQNSSKDANPDVLKPNLSRSLLPSSEKKLKPGETSSAFKYLPGESVFGGSESRYQNRNQSSPSDAVRKILEHLDRNKPTPKEKAAELKLATAWRKSADEASDTIAKGNGSSLQLEELGSHKNTSFVHQKIGKEFNNDKSNVSFPIQFREKDGDKVDWVADKNSQKGSSSGVPSSGIFHGTNDGQAFGLTKTSNPQVQNLHENSCIPRSNGQKGTTTFTSLVPSKDQSGSKPIFPSKEMTTFTSLVPSNNQSSSFQGTKPFLPSISVNRTNPRAVSYDNVFGFTFPVSANSGVLTEPPTPSIMPSFSTNVSSQPKDVPSYSFGANKSTPRLVFSFPSTSSASAPDATVIKFQFGSDKDSRLSFKSLGKDTVCC